MFNHQDFILCYILASCSFFIVSSIFVLLSCKSLYILADIFFHFVGHFFHFLIVVLRSAKVFDFDKVQLTYFFFGCSCYMPYLRNHCLLQGHKDLHCVVP